MLEENFVKKVVSQCLSNDLQKLTSNDLRNDRIKRHLNNLKIILQKEYQQLSMEWLELCSKVERQDVPVKFKVNLQNEDLEINNSFVELDVLTIKSKSRFNEPEMESDDDS